jgi:hypothetical protein
MSALSSASSTRGRGSAAACGAGVSSSGSQRSASATTPAANESPASGAAATTRSGARWAVPIGTVTVKAVPTPGALSTAIAPPWRRTSSWTRARPMPVPSWVRARAPSTRWKRSKMCGSWSAAMPVPVSRTTSRAAAPTWSRVTEIPPRSVNLNAFDSRLRTIFSHRSRSTWTGPASGRQSTANVSPARSQAERKLLASSAVTAARSVGAYAAWTRPASMREKSSSALTSFCRRCALRRATASRPRCAGEVSPRASRSSTGPSSSVSGVRNSWLTLPKNAVLARSSAASCSARRVSAAYARASATAPATWSATSSRNPR